MEERDAYGLGYARVDDDPNASVLLAAMDATARWDATMRLRSWERERLDLSLGQRLLDVGCGLGDAAVVLGADLAPGGEIVGIDASAEMIAVARSRARSAGWRARFEVGDAATIGEPDASFDVVRCERTLQWLADPLAAVTEMVRLVRTGGLVSLIDTDWSTLEIDVGDDHLAASVHDAMQSERGRPSNVGGRLADLARHAGLDVVDHTLTIQRWNAWDPDASPAPEGCFSMTSLAADLVDRDHLRPDGQEAFVSAIHTAAREGRFAMALTTFAVVARRPERDPTQRHPAR